jgi:hypothetical protein
MSEGGFARIDPISNHTVFKDPDYYADLIKGRDLPVHTFSTFIHEATHHWCFTSPLGMALMLLYLSAARKALRWAELDAAGRTEMMNDLRTYQLVTSILRPLNEGLAQFAEYDALPPERGKLISPPMLASLTFLFNYPRKASKAPKDREHRVWYEIADEIKRWRLSRHTIERKSLLLLEPIDSRESVYLLGYLVVKQLWRSATRDYEELKDADVFMIFLRKLIYADHSLAAEFLDREKPPEERALGFTKGLQQRLSLIYLGFVADHMTWSEWEELLEPPGPELRGLTNPIDGLAFAGLDNQEQVAKGQDLRLKLIDEVIRPLGSQESRRFPDDYFLNLVEERPLMWLGDLKANWISTGEKKGRIVRGDDVIFDNYHLKNGPDRQLNQLTLDLYIDLYENRQLTTVRDDKLVFGFAMRDDTPERTRERWMKARMDRRRLAKLTEQLHSLVRPHLNEANLDDLIEKFWKEDEDPIYDRSYPGFAFDFNSQARDTIAKQGVAGVLEDNADLVRNVAAITLGASAGLTPERLMALSELELTPAETIARVKERWKFKDLPMAGIDEDGFLESAF